MLLLHDPHVDISVRDRSFEKLSEAAHSILNLVFAMGATNYDMTLLDPVVTVSL